MTTFGTPHHCIIVTYTVYDSSHARSVPKENVPLAGRGNDFAPEIDSDIIYTQRACLGK